MLPSQLGNLQLGKWGVTYNQCRQHWSSLLINQILCEAIGEHSLPLIRRDDTISVVIIVAEIFKLKVDKVKLIEVFGINLNFQV
ncbi:hypothetical protein MTR_2g068975 [Medicago truncatula]|uniref:Uncharacterized protein n=1 Tax=Medicago truncatula TaxID=3880 RepID=A0A072V8I2_MEDTR|nr:hypothetical protein MTR_2g068975 [Medicago truncatula]